MSMKTLLSYLVVGMVVAAPAFAQAASGFKETGRVARQGWASQQHVYAAEHYTPWYDSYGNNNMNPDFQLVH
jgi:hypothetical protein